MLIKIITYRQSLANNLYDELQKQGFQNYNELANYEIQNAVRLIIQLNSLVRLNEKDDITQKNYAPNYD